VVGSGSKKGLHKTSSGDIVSNIIKGQVKEKRINTTTITNSGTYLGFI